MAVAIVALLLLLLLWLWLWLGLVVGLVEGAVPRLPVLHAVGTQRHLAVATMGFSSCQNGIEQDGFGMSGCRLSFWKWTS